MTFVVDYVNSFGQTKILLTFEITRADSSVNYLVFNTSARLNQLHLTKP